MHWFRYSLASIDEPVTVAEAVDYLVRESSEDDARIGRLITAAREVVEHETFRQLMPAVWKGAAEGFPGQRWGINYGGYGDYGGDYASGESWAFPMSLGRNGVIRSDVAPVLSVTSIVYVDGNGGTQTLASNAYQVDTLSTPARIAPVYSTFWPWTRPQFNAVTITVAAGYSVSDVDHDVAAQQAAIPRAAKDAILMLVSKWFDAPQMIGRIEDSWRDDFNRVCGPLVWRGNV